MPDKLKNVLSYVITAVNFIKAKAFNSHLFAKLCKESDSEFAMLLLHSQVRRLFRGNTIKRIFWKEVHNFSQDAKPDLQAEFSDDHFLICLAFLVVMFKRVNAVNPSLQGKDITIFYNDKLFSKWSLNFDTTNWIERTLPHFFN